MPGHANGLIFKALDGAGESVVQETCYSIGGGFVVNESKLVATWHDRSQDLEAEKVQQGYPYPFGTAAQMLQ